MNKALVNISEGSKLTCYHETLKKKLITFNLGLKIVRKLM